MRHLPARGQRFSRSGEGAGFPIGLETARPGRGSRGTMSAGRRRALGVVNSEGDSRPEGGGVEEHASSLESSGWVSMASELEGVKDRAVD